MKSSTKRNILFAAVVVASLGSIASFGPNALFSPTVSYEDARPTGTVEGEVLTIENVSGWREPARKEAIVKLGSGETVRAFVPPACILFAGQIATLSKFGGGNLEKASYVVKNARER